MHTQFSFASGETFDRRQRTPATWVRRVLVIFAASFMIAASSQAQPRDDAWLAGRWVGEGLGGGEVEESWSKPSAAQSVGYFRLIVNGEPSFTNA